MSVLVELFDFKYGSYRVLADGPQMRLYALGVLTYLPRGIGKERVWFRNHIVQPRINHHDIDTLSLTQLLEWAETIVRPAAEQALQEDAPLTPGETQCKFCRARASCRARFKMNMSMAKSDFAEPDFLSNEELALAYSELPQLESWCSAVKGEFQSRLLGGQSAPGWKVVEGRSTRRWRNDEEVVKTLRRHGWLKRDCVQEKVRSVADVEKQLGRAKMRELLSDLVVRPPGNPVVVKELDPRESITRATAQEDFE